jgi:hypothetical protein
MHDLAKYKRALLPLTIALASTFIFGQTLPVVMAAESPGALDPSSGIAGKVTTDFGGFDTASSVVIQPDRKIIMAGNHIARSIRQFTAELFTPAFSSRLEHYDLSDRVARPPRDLRIASQPDASRMTASATV